MFRVAVIACALALAACTTAANDMVWGRLDGRLISQDPALKQQFDVDFTVCRGEVAKADAAANDVPLSRRQHIADDVEAGCMAAKGYSLRQRP
jgi:hypothetical protein